MSINGDFPDGETDFVLEVYDSTTHQVSGSCFGSTIGLIVERVAISSNRPRQQSNVLSQDHQSDERSLIRLQMRLTIYTHSHYSSAGRKRIRLHETAMQSLQSCGLHNKRRQRK